MAGRSEAEHCTPPTSGKAAGEQAAGDGKPLQLGVLIRGKWKLLWGYPGWRESWDGWVHPPANEQADTEAVHKLSDNSSGLKTPFNGTVCVGRPCLHNLEVDPHERDDVAAAHPSVIASMKSRLLELLASEVTLADSGLCPTSLGSKSDPRGTAVAVATGFWQPWLGSEAGAESFSLPR
eukprot:1414789-Prymnesium_polylepis.1